MVKPLQPHEPSCFLYFGLEPQAVRMVGRHGWHAWWHQTARYQQRIHSLYQELIRLGERPALSLDMPARGTVYAVYPHLPKGVIPNEVIQVDPLVRPREALRNTPTTVSGDGHFLRVFVPKGVGDDLLGALRACRPRCRQDYMGFLPEAALRAAYRLTPGRHIF